MLLQELSPSAPVTSTIPEELPSGCRWSLRSVPSGQLLHPLVTEGGGDYYHGGGKHWNTFIDPEWQTIANWVCGRKVTDKIVELTGACGE